MSSEIILTCSDCNHRCPDKSLDWNCRNCEKAHLMNGRPHPSGESCSGCNISDAKEGFHTCGTCNSKYCIICIAFTIGIENSIITYCYNCCKSNDHLKCSTDHYNVVFGRQKEHHVIEAIDCVNDWIRFTDRIAGIGYYPNRNVVAITGVPYQRDAIKKRLDLYLELEVCTIYLQKAEKLRAEEDEKQEAKRLLRIEEMKKQGYYFAP